MRNAPSPDALRRSSGEPFPRFGLGTWLSEPDAVYRAVRHALEVGYRHIDCAWIYQNEDEVGRALKEALAAGVAKRDDLWITTKLWNDCHAPEHVEKGLDASLKLLGLDYVDAFLIHWPVSFRHGLMRPAPADFIPPSSLPLAKTWDAMVELSEDKARFVGVSNYSLRHIDTISKSVGIGPSINQVELHPYLSQNALVRGLAERGIVATAYSPLGSGGRPDGMKADDEPILLADPVVVRIAERHEATPAQVLIAWALARGTAVIPKSTNPTRLEQNLAGSTLALSTEDNAELDKLDRGRRYVDGTFWCPEGSPYDLDFLWGEG